MSRVRSASTGPELAVRQRLWRCGFRYRLRPKLPGRPDIAFLGLRLAVFVDGCFWHVCPEHATYPRTRARFWRAKLAANVERDRAVDAELEQMGFRVLRFWEHDISDDPDAVITTIAKEVRAARRRLGAA